MPQVKAFLNRPLFSRRRISRSSPAVRALAVAAAKAMAPGSVTPRAGRISSQISRVNSRMVRAPFQKWPRSVKNRPGP